ncbi:MULTISPECIES: hypothetical protein [Streptomyces]|uniref:hypothetical protein n=1 Tax=Streptomyces TaxID=1883 RepID=UPI002556A3D1|nr:hypothetical protein [Streptomyces sp. NBRC 13847]
MVLPADFTAFRQLHHDVYQHFAQYLLACHDTASDAVQHALGDLAASWTQVLADHRTAAIAWKALTHRIQRAGPLPAPRPTSSTPSSSPQKPTPLSSTASSD